MTKKSLTYAAVAGIAAVAAPAHALTVGEARLLSYTEQPLRVLIPIKAQPWEWKAMWASAQTYQKGLGLVATLYKPNGEKQDGFIELRSKHPVTEPILDVQITFDTGHRTTIHRTPILLDQDNRPSSATPLPQASSTLSVGNATISSHPPVQLPPAPPLKTGNSDEIVAPIVNPPDTVRSTTYKAPGPFTPNSIRSSTYAEPVQSPEVNIPSRPQYEQAVEKALTNSYSVVRGDTLYKIAKQLKPSHLSVDDAIAMLYKNNLHAFKGSSYKTLQAGAELTLSWAAPEISRRMPSTSASERMSSSRVSVPTLKKDLQVDGAYEEASEQDVEAAMAVLRRGQLKKEYKALTGVKVK